MGTVVAFAGVWPPTREPEGERWTEDELGWKLCDGSSIPESAQYSELRAVLPDSVDPRVPNYQGYFLRGFDPDAGAEGVDKDANRELGSNQDYATARPQHAFRTGSPTGTHTHRATTTARRQGGPNTFDSGSSRGMGPVGRISIGNASGNHTHVVSGGDAETRPINVAVNYIIKFGPGTRER